LRTIGFTLSLAPRAQGDPGRYLDMKKINIIITVIFAIMLLSGCSSTKVKYLAPDEFMARARTIDSSASTERFVGTGLGRVYYEYSNFITLAGFLKISDKPKRILYWTDLEKVPPAFIEKLTAQKKEYYELLEEHKNKEITNQVTLRDDPHGQS
jgi:hypothetical protein